MKLYGSHNRFINVLDLGDNLGLRPNNEGTNTLHEFQQCDDGVEVEHMRHNQPKKN